MSLASQTFRGLLLTWCYEIGPWHVFYRIRGPLRSQLWCGTVVPDSVGCASSCGLHGDARGFARPKSPTVQESDPTVPDPTRSSDTIRSSPSRPWARVPAAAVFAVLLWAALAPANVQAGCSYLVTSRNDHLLLPSVLVGGMTDRGDGAAVALHPSPTPWPASPCRGASCGDAPSVPSVPAGTTRIRAESWASCASPPGQGPLSPWYLLAEVSVLHASRRVSPILRPPRTSSPA
jgi:hypothetical protein